MKARDFIEWGGIEIANENRTQGYIRAGLLPSIPVSHTNCGCSATDAGPYTSPGLDPAPWVDIGRGESAQFLGVITTDITLDPIISRNVTPRFGGGATVGKMRPRHRIVGVQGLMLASSEQGMAYGERWLNDILAGVIVGCAPDTMRLLLSCPEVGYSAQFRTLRRVGIVDGPTFGKLGEFPSCFAQEVSFQIAAGLGYLLADEMTCMEVTV